MIEQQPMVENLQLWKIENIQLSGLGSKIYSNRSQTQVTHYLRASSLELWDGLQSIIDVNKNVKIFDVTGDPGSGKSTTVFGWSGYQCTTGKTVCFVTQTEAFEYQYTYFTDNSVHKLNISTASDELFKKISMLKPDVVVFDSFKVHFGSGNKGPGSSTWAVHKLLNELKKKKIVIVLCSSLQSDAPAMKSYASAEYSIRGYFMCGWTESELASCRQLSRNKANLMMLPELVTNDKGPFIRKIRLAGGNMRLINTEEGEIIRILDECIAKIKIEDVLSGSLQHGHPDVTNTIFVHTTPRKMVLLSAYVEDVIAHKVKVSQVEVAKLLDPHNQAFQGWLLEILMKLLFRDSCDCGKSIVFRKRRRDWLHFFPEPLKLSVTRIVNFGELHINKNEWYVKRGEEVVFLPIKNNQGLFDSVAVKRDGTDRYDVYFFQATVSKTHHLLFAYGGIFLARLFPSCLEGSIAERVKNEMKERAAKSAKEVERLEVQHSPKYPRLSEPVADYTLAEEPVAYGGRKSGIALSSVSALKGPAPEPSAGMVLKPSGDEPEMDVDASHLTVDVSAFDTFDQVSPLTDKVEENRPREIQLHFYIVTPKATNDAFDLKKCATYDIECMTQFDSAFTQTSVRVTYME